MERVEAKEVDGECGREGARDEGCDGMGTRSCRCGQDGTEAGAQSGCEDLEAGVARAKARRLRATARRRRLSASQKRRLRADGRTLGRASIAGANGRLGAAGARDGDGEGVEEKGEFVEEDGGVFLCDGAAGSRPLPCWVKELALYSTASGQVRRVQISFL